jgi:hypothetical protein
MIKILDIPVNDNDFLTPKTDKVFKEKERLKTCPWVPIDAMGPACIDSTVPPSLLRRNEGSIHFVSVQSL